MSMASLPMSTAVRTCRSRLAAAAESLEPRTLLAASLVKDINVIEAGSSIDVGLNVGGTLYFAYTQPETGTELWKSDGTPLGTHPVKDITPGPDSSNIS